MLEKIVLSSRHTLGLIPKSILATPEDQQTRTKTAVDANDLSLRGSDIIDQTCVSVQYLISGLDIEQVHLGMLKYKLPPPPPPRGSGSLIYALVARSANSICQVHGLMCFQAYEHGCLWILAFWKN